MKQKIGERIRNRCFCISAMVCFSNGAALPHAQAAPTPRTNGADKQVGTISSVTGKAEPGRLSLPLRAFLNEIDAELMKHGKQSDIDSLIRKYQQKNVCTEDYYHSIAGIFLKHRRYQEATQCISEGLTKYPKSLALHLFSAQIWLAVSETSKAKSELNICLSMAPHSETVHAELAGLYNQQGKLDQALSEIDMAIACNPQRASHWLTKAVILSYMDKIKESVVALDKAVSLSPGDSYDLRKIRGPLLERLGRYEDAIKDYQYLIKSNPTITYKAPTRIGCCYMALKKPKQALPFFDQDIKKRPNYMPAHKGRLSALIALNEQSAVAEEQATIKRIAPDYGD
jgi:tetratricopeptide (TPR) repeat protein